MECPPGPLELVHCDFAGPVDPVSIDGYRYALSFTDDYPGLIMTYFLKQKSGTAEATKKFLSNVSPFGKVKCLWSDLTVKRLRSDNGSEFISKEFEALLVMVYTMKSLLPIHPIRMEQQREAGAHYLRWVDVYLLKLNYLSACRHVQYFQPHIFTTVLTMSG